MDLFLFREPRSIVLASDTSALVFRPPPEETRTPSAAVEFLARDDLDLEDAVPLLTRPVHGCLGLIRIAHETFIVIVTSIGSIGTNNKQFTGIGTEPICRIQQVDFFCLTSANFDGHSSNNFYEMIEQEDAVRPTNPIAGLNSTFHNPGSTPTPFVHPCDDIKKIISNGSFYYTQGKTAFDLSTRLEKRLEREKRKQERQEDLSEGDTDPDAIPEDNFDPKFLWNTFMVEPLLAFRATLSLDLRAIFDQQGFVVLTIQGYCGVYDTMLGDEPAVLSLISRLGWERAGTRYNVRGVDDDGCVANFVETETILRTPSFCFAYTQVRGSVPVFWEENGVQPFGLKITVTRPLEVSLPAFTRHMESLLERYKLVHLVNLLGMKDQEAALTESYKLHLKKAAEIDENISDSTTMTHFDFHAKSRAGGIENQRKLLASVLNSPVSTVGNSLISVGADGKGTLIDSQNAVFRTNCKDCLDRTNVVQEFLSAYALEKFLRTVNPSWMNFSLASLHGELFAENGDALSRIYVGTGAINTSFTRSGKKSFAGILSDASKSVSRMYQSSFMDSGKQRAIDALLGHLSGSEQVSVYNPINDALSAGLNSREKEYVSSQSVLFHVGTYNINGRPPTSESLGPWIFPSIGEEPYIIALAFQELVPLTPQMIMLTDPDARKNWEAHIMRAVNNRPDKKSEYIFLRSEQLVGTALVILIKSSIAHEIRGVESSTVKTGLKGIAGNKGGVAIRLDFRSTSICFVTAHLAAGHGAIEERHSNYHKIAEELRFSHGRRIRDHSMIIWAADTNYRISLPNTEARYFAQMEALDSLLAQDQLLWTMNNKRAFVGYTEGPILFPPTYKYDIGSDEYDTSEKQRVPAWTDRILYRGEDLDLVKYQRAELYASDHRPVYAVMRANIRAVNQQRKATIRKQVLDQVMATIPSAPSSYDIDRHKRIVQATQVTHIPPPSSDSAQWWTKNGGLDILPLMKEDKKVPPPIPPKPTGSTSAHKIRRVPPPPMLPPMEGSSPTSKQLQPPPVPARPSSKPDSIQNSPVIVSLIDDDIPAGAGGNWEVIVR